MKRALLFIFNLAFSFGLLAQADTLNLANKDSVHEDEIRRRLIIPSIALDYGKLATTAAGWENKLEASMMLLFMEQYYLNGVYGQATLQPENAIENGIYESEGSYFRLGGGYLTQINPTSKLGIGMNYAQSSYQDKGTYFLASRTGVQDDINNSFGPRNGTARWVEVMITSESKVRFNKKEPEAKINQLFALGFHFSIRFLSSYDRYPVIDAYSIPGFGRIINDPVPALSFYLRFYPF